LLAVPVSKNGILIVYPVHIIREDRCNALAAKRNHPLIKNSGAFARSIEIIFGIIWGIDGAFKFMPGFVSVFPQMLQSAAAGQPSWLGGWFLFWSSAIMGNPAVFVYMIGLFELAISFALIFGFMRKIAYGGGIVLSLLIWAVPEGFGGPYGPGSTDIGTGIVYAIVFLLLFALALYNRQGRLTLDAMIGRRVRWWKKVAEFG
jgi:uncharacterized membrane protein YphA (DoxX/SURF4 family)